MADIAVNSSSLLNDQGKRVAFFSQLGPFVVDSSRLVLVGDWMPILDPKIDRRRGASGRSLRNRSLVDLIGEFGLVDRYRVNHPEGEMWTWACK